MAQDQPLISTEYPYLPIRVEVRGHIEQHLALLDTGYDGNLVIPSIWRDRLGRPDGLGRLELGDGSIVPGAPVYFGTLNIINFYTTTLRITALGDEYIIGRAILDLFEITLDRGQRVIVRL